MKNSVKKIHNQHKKKINMLKVVKKASKKASKKVIKSKVRVKVAKINHQIKNESSSKVVTRKRTSSISLSVKQDTVHGPINIKPYLSRKHERYMNSKQLEHFRSVLLQWKNQLMQEINRAHNLQDEIVNYPDLADRASQEEEFNLELRARDREYKLLRKIDETLNRINDHDYGYCNDCGAEIGISRLEARPTTNQCVECKTIAEIRKRQIGDSRLFE